MKIDIYKNHNISARLEHVLKQLEITTSSAKQNLKTPAHGGEDGKKAKDFPRI